MRGSTHVLLLVVAALLSLGACPLCRAGFACFRDGREQPLYCRSSSKEADSEIDDVSSGPGPAARLKQCLWRLMPYPFVTSVVNLTIRLPYPVPGIKHCTEPRCETVSTWNAALHHPEHDIHLSKSFLYEKGASGHEMTNKEIFLRYLKTQEDPLVLDIGANIGTHSLWFASSGYRTHSFEPLKKNFALLHCSVTATPEVQGRIRINNFGLGKQNMEVCMVSEAANMGGTHAVALDGGKAGGSTEGATGGCAPGNVGSVRTLDWYWEKVLEEQQVFFLKADIEGFEAHMVEGAQAMFSQRPPLVMVVEYVPNFITQAGGDAAAFLERLHGLGYVAHNPWTNETDSVLKAVPLTDLVLVHKSFLRHV